MLAELVGIGLSSATHWAKHAQRDWSPYLGVRKLDRQRRSTDSRLDAVLDRPDQRQNRCADLSLAKGTNLRPRLSNTL